MSRTTAEHFREQESSADVRMTSTSGPIGNFRQAKYSAAKVGVTRLSKSVALDMLRFNLRSNWISPFAWSRMTGSISATRAEQQARLAKIQQVRPDKNAPMAVFLGSAAAANVTGQIFATRHNAIFLSGQSHPLPGIHRPERWTAELIAEHAVPALRRRFCRPTAAARCSAGIPCDRRAAKPHIGQDSA